jgi:hypothetical protein
MMEAVGTSETKANIYLTTWLYIPEDSKLWFSTYLRKNLSADTSGDTAVLNTN